jgi:signal transduction histidine kinase
MAAGSRTSTDRHPSSRSEERLRAIVDRLADGVVLLDRNGTIKFANPAAEDLFGRTVEELAGSDLGFPSMLGDAGEIEVVRPGGATVTAELRVVETNWDGEEVRLVSIRDITDRKRAAERAMQLERERLARAEAEAASQAKSEFLATMSHELRTPLNAIIGYAELLDLGIHGALNEDQQKQVLRIRQSARHLLGLVNEVLDLAKVEAGKLSVNNQPSRADEVMDAATTLVQPIAENRGVDLEVRCDDPDLVFDGDSERVRQILVNLANNAVKFTAAGGRVLVRCSLETRPDPAARLTGNGPWICICVTDTGIGIPSDRLTSIFDPFVQVEGGHTRTSEGSGLGLTISRRLARLMGGDLTVKSQTGKGSAFTLWLREASAAQREAARWRAESPAVAARLHGLSDVAHMLLRDLASIVDSFVARLRDEAVVPGAESLRTSQLGDHAAAYIADLATLLAALEEARGKPSPLVADSADIQLFIAEKHGQQRAGLGWTPKSLHREWIVLSEEIGRVVRRAYRQMHDRAAPEAIVILERLIEQANERSGRALERALRNDATAASS